MLILSRTHVDYLANLLSRVREATLSLAEDAANYRDLTGHEIQLSDTFYRDGDMSREMLALLHNEVKLEATFAQMSQDICGNVDTVSEDYSYVFAKDMAEDIKDIVRKTLAAYCDKLTNPSEIWVMEQLDKSDLDFVIKILELSLDNHNFMLDVFNSLEESDKEDGDDEEIEGMTNRVARLERIIATLKGDK